MSDKKSLYRIVIGNKVSKTIDNLPSNIIQKIYETVKDLKYNPRPDKVKKLQHFPGYRIRIGSYRILYTIEEKDKLVSIYKVSHRKESYK